MKNLIKYIINENELGGNIDGNALYVLGVHALNSMEKSRADKHISKYNISKTDPKPGIIRMMNAEYEPLPDSELIPRNMWNFESLVGQCEGQLMNRAYYDGINKVFKRMNRKHDVLGIFQCSAKKPYYANTMWKRYKDHFGDHLDFACISNPGIIPWEFCNMYPFRYDEWNVSDEKKINKIIDITYKYRIVNMCRMIRYKRKLGYKSVVVTIPNQDKDWIFRKMIEKNIDGASDWCYLVITPQLRRNMIARHGNLGKISGLAKSRFGRFIETFRSFAKKLKMAVSGESDKSAVDDDWKEYYQDLKDSRSSHGSANESLKDPGWRILENITYSDIIKKFREYISDNLNDDGKLNLGDNNLYYQSYYWTVLDILLIGLDGNLVEDIDGLYWDLLGHLDKDDNEFVRIKSKAGDFLYAHKKLLEVDNVSVETCLDEAIKIGLIQKEFPKIELK